MQTVPMERRLCALALVMAALILGALAVPLFLGWVYVADDLGIFHFVARSFYARSLRQGESFLWWPNLLCGYYLHGDGQVGMHHPLHLLLYSTLPLVTAFNLELLLHYPCLLAGTFLLLRRWDIRRDAAMFGALVFTFSGFNLLHFVHPNMVAIVAHIPWLLLAIDEIMCGSDRRRVACAKLGVALLTTSQLLLGHSQAVWLSLVLEVLYLVWRTPAGQEKGRLWSLGEAKLLGFLSGSIQLLPTWDIVSHSIRVEADFMGANRYWHSLEPINLVQFVAPYIAKIRVFGTEFPREFGLYNGAIASVLPLWLLMRRKALESRRALALSALILGLLGLTLALGKYGYIYRLQAHLPLIRWLRVPVRYILLLHFAMAVGAALAFVDIATLVQRRMPLAWRQLWPLVVLPVASVCIAATSFWVRARPERFPAFAVHLASTGPALLGPVLITMATALVVAASRGMRWALAGIMVFAAVDQGFYGVSPLWEPFPPAPPALLAAGQAMPPEASPHRVQSDNNFFTMSGLSLAGGYVAFRPKRELDALHKKRLQIAGVQWLQTHMPRAPIDVSSQLDPLLTQDTRVTYDALGYSSSWARVPEPMARARFVTQAHVSAAPRQDIHAIDIASTALVSEALDLEGGSPGTVVLEQDQPGQIRLRTHAASRQLLVLSESWHAGWQATVDSVARPVIRVYGDFIGCVIEAGQHEVALRFQPTSLRLGGWLSALGLGLTLISCFGTLFRSTKDGHRS